MSDRTPVPLEVVQVELDTHRRLRARAWQGRHALQPAADYAAQAVAIMRQAVDSDAAA